MATRKTKSNRKANAKNTRQNKNNALVKNAMSGFKDQMGILQNKIKQYVNENGMSPAELGKKISRQWNTLFAKHLTTKQSKAMAKHYMSVFGKAKKGGYMAGAPLDYAMGPGMPGATTYGVFPTEAGADIKATQHLDVYYNSGLGRSCGAENTTASVPKDMGSNLVPAKGGRRQTRRKGGNFMSSLAVRNFTSSNPATTGQIMGESWAGQPTSVYNSYRPEHHAWKTVSNGQVPIFPTVTPIVSDMTQIANPSPYPGVSSR